MGFGLSLIIFSPNTIAKSADVNANFSAINGASTFSGTVVGFVDGSATALQQINMPAGITLDGSGNMTFPVSNPLGYLNQPIPVGIVIHGTGSGTFNHGLIVAPDVAYAISDTSSSGTTIYTVNSVNTTTLGIAGSAVEHWACVLIKQQHTTP